MQPKDRIIVALDVDQIDRVAPLVDELHPYVGCFKVGLELLTAAGAPLVVKLVHEHGGKVFFDGKFDDIPNTVGAASRAVASLGVSLFNVHASAGLEAIRAASQNKGRSRLLAVTVLTSHTEESCRRVFGVSPLEKVIAFAADAAQAGADGIVCSPKELQALSKEPKLKGLLKVTPGVRPAWAETDDQKRVLSPIEAIQMGADLLVIGRPILRPPKEIGSPVEAAKRIADEIAKGKS